MKKNFKGKLCAGTLALACVLNTSFVSSFVNADSSVRYEFEDGTHTSSVVPTEDSERWVAGASNGKFVFIENGGEMASVTVTAETTGMYDIILCYAASYGSKIHNLYVNGVDQGQISCSEEKWTETKLCSVKLNAGTNEIGIKSSWGWTNLDYLRIEESVLPSITNYDRTLSDENATASAKSFMSYLSDVYGKHVLSGQQEIYKYGPHDFEYEFEYIKDNTGKYPAIRGFEYLNCNPLYGSEDGTTERIIDWTNNRGGIATASWHITVPNNFAGYTIGNSVDWANATYDPKKTDFDTAKVLVEGTKENEYYMLCLKNLAAELQKLQDADVPLIFRPLHEAEGGGGETGSWFWWGKSGSAVYKDLWKLTYDTLVDTYGLHNLIWEWNSYAYETSANWYPGDDYVDLIAYDKYNCTDWSTGSPVLGHNDSAISGTFYSIVEKYNGKKMVAMSENDSIPTLNNLLEEKAAWLYFCPWYDGGSYDTNFLSNPLFNKVEDLIEMYQSDYCITLDELPENLKTYSSEIVEPTTEPVTTTAPITTTAPVTTEPDVSTTEPDVTTTAPVTTDLISSETTITTTESTSGIKVPDGVVASKYGDVNVDGDVNVADIVSLNMFLLNQESNPLSDVRIANSDCVRDGIINTADSTLLMNYVAMMINIDKLGAI